MKPEKLWRIPAALSSFALGVLPLAFVVSTAEPGSSLREVLAHLLAFGICAAVIGLGLGLWLALRVRRSSAFLSALFSVAVAVAWWILVFAPMIEGRMPAG